MSDSQTIVQQLTEWINDTFTALYPDIDRTGINTQVVATSGARFGDYQCNAAMSLAKRVKKAPRDIATAVLEQPVPEIVERLEIAGPGFINFHLKTSWLSQRLEQIQDDEMLGVSREGTGKTMVIDYSSPNIAKPMHIGHIRSTVIGNALDRMYRFLGYKMIADNHIGDWGTQFGLMIIGYKHFINKEALAVDPIEELERIYRESYKRSQDDPAWLDSARSELVKLQQGDEDNRALWEQFIEWSKVEFNAIYQRLGVRFDLERGESYYRGALQGVIDQLVEQGIATKSEGALVVDLEEEGLPVSLVQKSDGGFNYTTTDLATVQSRETEFHPDEIIYVTDERQQLHFRQFFAIAKKMGMKVKLKHVWFGLMRLPEATFSTRQGNVIKLEKLLDEAEERALELVKRSSSELSSEQQIAVARAVGIGAVKYADLSQNPQSLVTFTWEKAMSLEGNSAPYLQYAYARIASVCAKYKTLYTPKDYMDFPLTLQEPVERKLAIHLLRFNESVSSAAGNYRPNYLADYLYELAQIYSNFYQTVPFLKADEGIRESRVRLCDLVAKVLRTGLDLLGIETPERI